MYNELRKLLTRDFRSTLSGVRGYAESALDYHGGRRDVLKDRSLDREEKRQHMDALRIQVEQLSVILFTYAMYLRFLSGDQAIKNAVAAFESLNVNKVMIGSMNISRDSKYYDMGKELATSLMECIQSQELKELFHNKVHFYEISHWYRNGAA